MKGMTMLVVSSSIKNNYNKYDNKREKKQHSVCISSSTRSSAHGRDEEDKKRNTKRSNSKNINSKIKRKHYHNRSSSNQYQ